MTLLAGLSRFHDELYSSPLSRAVSAMIGRQHRAEYGIGRATPEIRLAGRTAFGRLADAIDRHRPSDVPSDCLAHGMLFAADARIDNRDEMLGRLGRHRDDPVDDEDLMLLAYGRWGDRLVDHLVGDFAYAAWDPRNGTLTLARDPTGQRPLHYRADDDGMAFASMPQGLLALDKGPSSVDADRLARFVAGIPQRGPESFFRGVMRVEPAQIVRLDRSGVRAERYWRMPTRELRYRRSADYVDAFREVLDRATGDRLRDGGRLAASHLSAGLDSGTVTATAARLMAQRGGTVLAITSAPRADFAGPVPRGRIADESPLAAAVAAQYPNVEHVVLRSNGLSPIAVLDEDSQRFGHPVGYPCNNMWWRQANATGQARGATVMLTGEMGNLTISAGGLGVLADYVRTGRYLQWLREAMALERRGPRWRGLMAASFAPWIPTGTLAWLRRFAAGGRAAALETLVSDRFRDRVEAEAARFEADQARLTEREIRWQLLGTADPGNFRKGAWLTWGIDERDPTADRRVAEFCFSLPPDQLLGGGETRRLARTALADRLPASVLNGPRGYQFADWYEAVDRPSLVRAAERIGAHGTAAQVLNMTAINRMVAAWPPGDWASMAVIGGYRVGLLRALSAGIFALKAGG